jgi:hypothetical protein
MPRDMRRSILKSLHPILIFVQKYLKELIVALPVEWSLDQLADIAFTPWYSKAMIVAVLSIIFGVFVEYLNILPDLFTIHNVWGLGPLFDVS